MLLSLSIPLLFIPMFAIYIPAAVKGFYIESAAYVLGNLFLYLMVGIAEEIYFRGIIPKYFDKMFSLKGVIFFSTVISGIGHVASAFTVGNGAHKGIYNKRIYHR